MKIYLYARELAVFASGILLGTIVTTLIEEIKTLEPKVITLLFISIIAMVAVTSTWWLVVLVNTRLKYGYYDQKNNAEQQEKLTTTHMVLPSPTNTTITFPYSTHALVAAQAAAIEYWIDFDPERLPLQKKVGSFIAERGVPIRQAAELANAIKPDDIKEHDTTA